MSSVSENLLFTIASTLARIEKLLTPTATTPHIVNIPITSVNTEQRYPLPQGVRSFTVKARNGNFQVAFSQGETSINYVSLPSGSSMTQDKINTYLDAVFFQADNAAGVLELILWRA